MIVDEWHDSRDAWEMIRSLEGWASDRKIRLFAAGCCRLAWDSIRTVRCRRAVETAERFADGSATLQELQRAFQVAQQSASSSELIGGMGRFERDYDPRMQLAAEAARPSLAVQFDGLARLRLDFELADKAPGLLRCIFGPDPFRPAPTNLGWLSPPAVDLARSIYEDRDFGNLPFLGDALEEAGCGLEEVLRHCRDGGPHARGCWVVDLVLGKK
jgi:hypothetical protein